MAVDKNKGISFSEFALMDNGNPYGYNFDDVIRFYANNLGDRVKDWFRNYQAQRILDNANKQQQVNEYDWMRRYPIGY